MELQPVSNNHLLNYQEVELPFIEANTLPMTLFEMEQEHIIPVFTKDNHALISQHEYIHTVQNVLSSFHPNDIMGPFIRVSHPVRGRVPSARFKKAHELLPQDETLYYERMMFVYIIPSMTKVINGQELKLTIGGVKAYNKDNLNKNRNALQHFSFFMGFQVKVCSNLCVWSDGIHTSIRVNSLEALSDTLKNMMYEYNPLPNIQFMKKLCHYSFTEKQFAHLLGRCRMFNFLPKEQKIGIVSCGLNDSQLTVVTRQFYQDEHFSSTHGNIDLWSFYNLCTAALKSSYLDTFLENNVQIGHFFQHIVSALEKEGDSWYLIR